MKKIKKRLLVVLMLVTMFIACQAISVSAAAPRTTEFKAYPGYNSVILAWRRVPEAKGYVCFYKKPNGKYVRYRVWEHNPSNSLITVSINNLALYKDYAFRITAYVNSPDEARAEDGVMAHAEPVRPMTYRLHGRGVTADGFTAGKYIVNNYKGQGRYLVTKARAGGVSAIYTRKWNYGKFTAESFVNAKGVSSKTNRLVWVSTYTQHAYYFEGSKGHWVMKDHWECSTGKPSAPTPTGNNYQKEIWRKTMWRHNIQYWSPFSSWNSIHGGYDNSDIGHPESSGCVGNLDRNAKTVYNKCGIGTTVVIF